MNTPNYLTVEYDSGSSLIIEGFGPNSIAGIVKDVLEGHYPVDEERPQVKSIKISDKH